MARSSTTVASMSSTDIDSTPPDAFKDASSIYEAEPTQAQTQAESQAESASNQHKASWLSSFFSTHRKAKMVAVGALFLGIVAVAVAVPVTLTNASKSSVETFGGASVSLVAGTTLLLDNDLVGANSTGAGLIMLGPRSLADADADCKALGEALWAPSTTATAADVDGVRPLLNYLGYQGQSNATQRFWIGTTSSSASTDAASARTINGAGDIAASDTSDDSDDSDDSLVLPAFCTHSAPYKTVPDRSRFPITVRAAADSPSNGAGGIATFQGYRDRSSFRFLGIRYGAQPERFTYPTPYWNSTASRAFNATTTTTTTANTTAVPVHNATKFGAACVQAGGGSEDCLFLNVYTPYVPPQHGASATAGSTPLRPVLFWMHGGGLAAGSASDPFYDGGNFASRGDAVVVTVNYRLSTLGYLALDEAHGNLTGNYGLADQLQALDWVRDNIAAFGGDPARITISGQSAGAASARAIMASPRGRGKFVGALVMSSLGGLNYGQPYSAYRTIANSTASYGVNVLAYANCTAGPPEAIVACLRAVPAHTLIATTNLSRRFVIDGTYLTTDQVELAARADGVAPYAVLMGTMRDDGASFSKYPQSQYTEATAGDFYGSQGWPNVSSTLFPLPGTGNVTLDLFNVSSRLTTDGEFRCVDQATVHAGVQSGVFSQAYYYEFDRGYAAGSSIRGLCVPPATDAYPHGDPSQPYFRCHSGDLFYVFGNVARQGLPMRDDGDLPFMQYVLDSFASFVHTQTPNADPARLRARGFTASLALQKASDAWASTTATEGAPLHVLDWPKSYRTAFRDQAQCDSLGLGLTQYL